MMMPPPGSQAQGFIPDAVPRQPHAGELVWGQPYCFVEAKARKELSLTGNLKAMLEYVESTAATSSCGSAPPGTRMGATRLTDHSSETSLEALAAEAGRR